MTDDQARELCDELQKKFPGTVERELVNGQGRYRFALTSEDFKDKTQLQRQDEVWEVVDKTLPREATLDISLILTFAPSELESAEQ